MRQLRGGKSAENMMSGYGSHEKPVPQSASLRSIVVAILCAFLSGCGGDDAEPAAESVSPVPSESSPNTKPDTSIPGHTGLPNTTKKFDPPEVPEPREIGSEPNPQPPQPKVFRQTFMRSDHDEKHLATFGLSRFSTEHLELITDLPEEKAKPLVPLVDALHPFLEYYFGKLPPARDGSDYRVTGFVMQERSRFVQSRLAKSDLLNSFHGRQIGAEFWMNNQTLDYYRRHLLLHEAVHCYMRHFPGEATFPLWYLEGMAEMIATHRRRIDDEPPQTSDIPQPYTFNVMPFDRMRFRGLERIIILQRDVKKNGVQSIGQIRNLSGNDFKDSVESYAWCWALCRFLDSHPATKEKFRGLAKNLMTTPPDQALRTFFGQLDSTVETEWALFASGIEHGYDFDSHAIVFQSGRPLDADLHLAEVDSSRSWQTTLLKVQAGRTYSVAAAGQFDLESPLPRESRGAPTNGSPSFGTTIPGALPGGDEESKSQWISEANGVSICYHKGEPLGRLLGAIHVEGKPHAMLKTIPLGNSSTFTAGQAGTLYLRVNDRPDSLANNRGKLSVSIRGD